MNPLNLRARIVATILFTVVSGGAALAQNLKVHVEAERLRVSSSQFHFLNGRPLDRLHNGSTVTYLLRLTVRSEKAGRVLARVAERFTFSYDLWEEKFSVTWVATPTRSVSNLAPSAAEAWCLENLNVPQSQLPMDRPIWVAVEYESEETKDSDKDSPLAHPVSSMIDIFSRKSRDEEQVKGVSEEVGPLRMQDLIRKKQGSASTPE